MLSHSCVGARGGGHCLWKELKALCLGDGREVPLFGCSRSYWGLISPTLQWCGLLIPSLPVLLEENTWTSLVFALLNTPLKFLVVLQLSAP